MKKQQLRYDIKVDLHGYTQDEAFYTLLNAIPLYYQQGLRNILIITGKSGVLKQNVPNWLEGNQAFNCISSISPAPIYMGGDGALLIKLKKI